MALIRNLSESDYLAVLELNNSNTPAVSELNREGLQSLVEMAWASWAVEDIETKKLIGFCLILCPGQNYSSDNYQWVCDHYENFQYLDRVVISEKFQGKGFGRKLYEYWFSMANSQPLLVEVNIKPKNDGSIAFHEKLGFVSVGEQDTEHGKKRVQYMEKR